MAKGGGTWKAHAALVLVQVIFAGNSVVLKVALGKGANKFAYCAARNLVATSVLFPIAFFFERSKRAQLPISRQLVASFFLLGLTGIFGNQVLYLIGLSYTSPTYATAIQPAVPVFTFLLAALTGTEVVNPCKVEGLAKIGGTFVCISGAIFMAAYKGPAVLGKGFVKPSLLVDIDISAAAWQQPELIGWLAPMMPVLRVERWHLGVLCLIVNCFCVATYFVIQAPLLVNYPASLSVTAYSSLFGTLLAGLSGLLSTQPGDWSFTAPEIIAILYGGFLNSALSYGIMTWANKMLGPSLVALYIPLQPLASSILAATFLGSSIYIGSIIGGTLIIIGLYLLTWARHQEELQATTVGEESLLDEEAPVTKG